MILAGPSEKLADSADENSAIRVSSFKFYLFCAAAGVSFKTRGIGAVDISESIEVPGTRPIQVDKITPTGKTIVLDAGCVAP